MAGQIHRVTMDGLETEVYSFPESHHDLTVLPNDHVVFLERSASCDEIVELDLEGNASSIFDLGTVVEGTRPEDGCHSNSIHYHEDSDSFTVSVLNLNLYVHITRDGELLWIMGGDENQFEGVEPWARQHGHHAYEDRFVLFNNGNAADTAKILEYSIDPTAKTAELIWSYDSGEKSNVLGDVQRLDNGNTLVTYSASGVMHEVDEDGELVQRIGWSIGGATGYAMKRESLYGPPPR